MTPNQLSVLSAEKHELKHNAFPRCSAKEILWCCSCEVSRGSPDTFEILATKISNNFNTFSAPGTSDFAGDWNKYIAALSAAALAASAVCLMYELANVSAVVTSQVKHLPFSHGIKDMPSGHFCEKQIPVGSSVDCIFAQSMARQITSLTMLWQVVFSEHLLHAKQCSPSTSTSLPQGYACGWHKTAPMRRPEAIRTASLSRINPHLAAESAYNQSPECGANAASNLACWRPVAQSAISCSLFLSIIVVSQLYCLFAQAPGGGWAEVIKSN